MFGELEPKAAPPPLDYVHVEAHLEDAAEPLPFATRPSDWRRSANTHDAECLTEPITRSNAKVQVVKRVDAEVMTDAPLAPEAPDDPATRTLLERFLQARTAETVAALRENARTTAFDAYETARDEEEPVVCEHSLKHVGGLAAEAPESVTAVAWSCTGAIVAAGYGVLDGSDGHNWGSRKSVLCAWAVTRRMLDPAKADVVIELGDCVACLAFHPEEPTLIAGGSYNGDVLLWDLAQEDEPLVAKSHLSDYTHHEPVLKAVWVRQLRGGHQLVTLSGDGRVLQWLPLDKAHGLSHPVGGFTLLAPPASKAVVGRVGGHSDGSHEEPMGDRSVRTHGGTAISFSVEDPTACVAGTESGLVLKCSLVACEQRPPASVATPGNDLIWSREAAVVMSRVAYTDYQKAKMKVEKSALLSKEYEVTLATLYAAGPLPKVLFVSPVTFAYEPHSGPVYDVVHSPFHRNLFVTVATDSAVRLFSMLQAAPLLTAHPTGETVFCAAWSASRPLVFAVGSGDGRLHVYDLGAARDAQQLQPVETLQVSTHPVFSVAFNAKRPELVATGDGTGCVKVWRLSERLSQPQMSERDKLDQFIQRHSSTADGEDDTDDPEEGPALEAHPDEAADDY